MHKRRDILFPFLLIVAGVVALLSRQGMIAWNIRDLWRFWPLVLVLLGLEMVLARTRWGAALFLVIALAMVVGVGALSSTGFGDRIAEPSSASQFLTQELAGAESAKVSIEFGYGELQVTELTDSPNLMEGECVHYDDAYRCEKSYRVSNNEGYLILRSKSNQSFGSSWDLGRGSQWMVELNASVPLMLDVSIGAGEATLNLSRLWVTDLDLDGGKGRVEVVFPEDAGRTTADIDVGIGDVTLSIPEGVAARIEIDSGLGSVEVAERFRKEGDYYVSEGFGLASNRLYLEIEGGIGSISVR